LKQPIRSVIITLTCNLLIIYCLSDILLFYPFQKYILLIIKILVIKLLLYV